MQYRIAALLLAAAIGAWAQSFEVASVKVAPLEGGDAYSINPGTVEHDTFTMTNVSLADCIRYAYGLTSDYQLSAPEWATSKNVRFNIVAKMAAGTPQEQLRKMMQGLLAERFHLALHPEKRTLSYLALVVAKGGAKLTPATDSPAVAPTGIVGQLRIVTNKMPMFMLATILSRYMRAFVVDQTGLDGSFTVKLIWTPDDRPIPEDQRGPSVFTAVTEQLGLKLESRTGPLDVLVVDRADREPVEN